MVEVRHVLFGLALAIGLTLRAAVGVYDHSGRFNAPKFGDYEAQRHWMEITVNLPVSQWYHPGPDNDLQYWGLDYPPLSAYLAWSLGQVSKPFAPELTALHLSRGWDTPGTRAYMRLTVIAADLLVLVSALYAWSSRYVSAAALNSGRRPSSMVKALLFGLILLQPAFILIDHGHFQYNCVALGLSAWAALHFLADRPILGCVCFVAALLFKQMALYFAPTLFFFVVGRWLLGRPSDLPLESTTSGEHDDEDQDEQGDEPRSAVMIQSSQGSRPVGWSPRNILRFLGLVFISLGAAVLILLPFLEAGQLRQLLHRVFPVQRGLFEDMVANWWCVSHPVFRWKTLLATSTQLRACLVLTALLQLPSGLMLMLRPTGRQLVLALGLGSLVFFQFSYHVHEKSLLLPLLPISGLLLLELGPLEHLLGVWFGALGAFSMWPLLLRDGLALPYAVLMGIWVLAGWKTYRLLYGDCGSASRGGAKVVLWFERFVKLSLASIPVVHLVVALLPEIPRYPWLGDLFISGVAGVQMLAVAMPLLWWLQFQDFRRSTGVTTSQERIVVPTQSHGRRKVD